jgi:hypothetical protein
MRTDGDALSLRRGVALAVWMFRRARRLPDAHVNWVPHANDTALTKLRNRSQIRRGPRSGAVDPVSTIGLRRFARATTSRSASPISSFSAPHLAMLTPRLSDSRPPEERLVCGAVGRHFGVVGTSRRRQRQGEISMISTFVRLPNAAYSVELRAAADFGDLALVSSGTR